VRGHGFGRRAAVAALVLSTLAGCGKPASEPAADEPGSDAAAPVEHQLLWPFSTVDAAEEWQANEANSGSAAWHLDPEETALGFTTGYLGLTDVDQVVDAAVEQNSAEVTVGYRGETDRPTAAGVLRLVRLGTGEDAPWEVVGTKDENLTITEPGDGATVSSPLRVGGKITGVDESIRVRVHAPAQQTPLGEACCVAAGGENRPWTTTVPLTGSTTETLTVVATTGGHIADVERFAVTGVRMAG
jgi:hypothetical protein